jgi:hypothetical protein
LGSLRALRVDRLRGKLSTGLLLLLLVLSLRALLMLLLLLLLMGPLQDLGGIMTWRSTMHARKRWLSVREVLRWVALGQTLRRTLILHLLDRKRASRLIADALGAHHCFDLVQAHQLPGGGSLRSGRWRLALRSMLLLGLQPPNVCARFQLGDVFGVFVVLVAAAGLRGLGHRGLVLLGRSLAGLEEHLLLLQHVGDAGGLARKVEVLVDGLLELRAAEGVVVEGVVGIVEVVAESIVRLLKVDAAVCEQWRAECGGDLHIIVACPAAAEASEGVVLPKAGGIGSVAAVPREGGVEAEKGHGGRCAGWVCLRCVWIAIKYQICGGCGDVGRRQVKAAGEGGGRCSRACKGPEAV